jgi:hypothetical protein
MAPGRTPKARPPTPTRRTPTGGPSSGLLETVAGDDLGSTYRERQPAVRQQFDPLEQQWSQEVDKMFSHATAQDWQKLTKTAPMMKRYRPHVSSSKIFNAMHRRHWLTGRR